MDGACGNSALVVPLPGNTAGTKSTSESRSAAPSTSLNALVRYHWPVGNNGDVAIQLDGLYNSDHFIEGTNSLVSKQDAYSVLNARVAYATDRWEIAAFAKNFTDEEYLLYNLDLGLAGFIEQVWAPPRQVGLTVSVSW